MQVTDLPGIVLSKGCQRIVQAWSAWRGDRLLPDKADMDLGELAEFMPWLGLLEVAGPDEARLRVAGSGLREVYGAEMTGRNLKDITAPEDWPRRSARYLAQVSRPCGTYYFRRDLLPDGKAVSYETVALPVQAGGGERQMLCIIMPLQQWHALGQPAAPHLIPMPTAFQYVDIGAGIPDAP